METSEKLVKVSSLQTLINSSTFVGSDEGKKGTATTGSNKGFGGFVREKILVQNPNIYKIATINTRGYAESLRLSGAFSDWFGGNPEWFWLVLNFRDDVQGAFFTTSSGNKKITFKVYDNNSKFDVYMHVDDFYPVSSIDLELYGSLNQAFTTHNLNQASVISEGSIPGTLVWNSSNNTQELASASTYASANDVLNLFGGGLINRALKRLKGVLAYVR